MMMRRIALWAGTALALSVAPVLAQDDRTLVVGTAINSTSYSPSQAYNSLSLGWQMWEPLTIRDTEDAIIPLLATSWEEVEPTRWRFTLRDGVKWSDGTDFTAADVKATLDYVISPESVYGRKSRIANVTGTEVVDDLTIDILTSGPTPTLPRGVSEIPIMQKALTDQVGFPESEKTPVGTGPWLFVDWEPGDHLDLKANPDYWGGKPAIENVSIRMMPDASARVASLLAGETDLVTALPVDLVPTIEARDDLSVVAKESSVSFVLNFDTRKPPFDDIAVRRAVDQAIDKKLLLDRMLGGRGAVLDGQLATAATFGYNPDLKPTPYDPEAAAEVLGSLELPDGFENQIMLVPGRYLSDFDLGNAIADMVTQAGLPTSVNPIESAVWMTLTGEANLGSMHAVGWYNLGDADFSTIWYTDAGRRNYWSNEEFNTLYEKAHTTSDPAVREQTYHRMMEIMNEELPAVFLFGLPQIAAVSDKLVGYDQPRDPLLRLNGLSWAE